MDTNKGKRREVKVRKIQMRKKQWRLGDSAARGGGRLARRRSVTRIVSPVTA